MNKLFVDLVAGRLPASNDAKAIARRLLVSMPPQHGKSEFFSKWAPSWYLGHFPSNRVIHNSYGDRYSQSWGRKARGVVRACGAELFGVAVSDEKSEQREWEIAGYGGSMFSAGTRGEITGRPCDLLIVDDPHKNAEEAVSENEQEKTWDMFQSGPLTRLSENAIVAGIATRWHQNDLFGRLIAKWTEENVSFRVVNLPAIAGPDDELGRTEGEPLCPELKSAAFLDGQRRTLSAYWWNSLYQGRPTQHERAEFPEHYFGEHIWCDEFPSNAAAVVVALDPSKGKNAKRGDYQAAVCVGVCHNTLYVDAILDRVPVGAAVDNTLALARRYGARLVPYEANNFQEEALAPIFNDRLSRNRLSGIRVVPVVHSESKEGRIQSLDPFLAKGSLRFVRSPGCKLLVNQLKEFPMALHDDGPDALEMAILHSLSLLNAQPQENLVERILRERNYQ